LDHQNRQYLILAPLLLLLFSVEPMAAQQNSAYETRLKPDLWYNSVDGIRAGARFQGRRYSPGHQETHRFDAGVWLGLWFPSLPVSYQVVYRRAVVRFSEPEQALNLHLASMIREGYQRHGVKVSKRWQPGDDFRSFLEISTGYHLARRFDDSYLLYRELWGDMWQGNLSANIEWQRLLQTGLFRLHIQTLYNTLETPFQVSSISTSKQIRLGAGWEVRGRIYGAAASRDSEPEYLFFLGSGAPIEVLSSPIFRSRGTVPPVWVKSGHLHYAAGPNLRGYNHSDIESIRNGELRSFGQVAAVNLELDIPNPLQRSLRQMNMAGEFLTFRSYLFGGGAVTGEASLAGDARQFAEGGAGIALGWNIPGESGRFRGFVIRYESPFWLSNPPFGAEWRWRHLAGIGAVITF